ncbi:hypothetical protein ACEPPN_005580 [Leptodophora sp. 'Broadleaf-Isolate-01']
MATTIVLITGANRGIAGNRDPNHPTSKALLDLPKAEGTTLYIIKIDATVSTDPADAVKHLASLGIDHLDIVIANAGIAYIWPKVSEVKVEDMQKHTIPNTYGIIWLYQATLPLLKKSKSPKWVSIGSSAAFLTNAAYAPTKVVLHWLTKAIHQEEPELCAFPVDLGWVQTDLGQAGADAFGYEKAAITVEESVSGLIKVIDASSRETHGGKLWVYDGQQVPW